ncbi:MAG: aspartate aminotransferase family protein [Deltaproteobacteria bacterium]|nr:aspartate aminotransferase family protein [Deltaproteobacteria bacterium]
MADAETLGASLPQIRTALPGPVASALVDTLARAESPAFTTRRARRAESSGAPQDPIVWAEAVGANVVDADGNVFVDLTGGFGVAGVGHRHPKVVDAVQAQAGRLLHALGDLHPSDVKIRLLERLAAMAPQEDARVILSLSGSDAVTTALKSAAIHTGRPGIVAFDGGYHGLDHGPLAACGYSEGFRAPFAEQLNPHVRFAPYGDASALDALLDDSVGAVIVEAIQGRGGCRVPPDGFLGEVQARARANGSLLIVDEIMTGLYRTGVPFASMHGSAGLDGPPDLICLGKGLGGGLPVSACIGSLSVLEAWGDPGQVAIHTGTFFGHPLGAAAALASLDVLEGEQLGERALAMERRLRTRLGDLPVRGRGLLLGVVPGVPALPLVRRLLERGFLAIPAGMEAEVIQVLPALTIDERLLDAFADALLEELDR